MIIPHGCTIQLTWPWHTWLAAVNKSMMWWSHIFEGTCHLHASIGEHSTFFLWQLMGIYNGHLMGIYWRYMESIGLYIIEVQQSFGLSLEFPVQALNSQSFWQHVCICLLVVPNACIFMGEIAKFDWHRSIPIALNPHQTPIKFPLDPIKCLLLMAKSPWTPMKKNTISH